MSYIMTPESDNESGAANEYVQEKEIQRKKVRTANERIFHTDSSNTLPKTSTKEPLHTSNQSPILPKPSSSEEVDNEIETECITGNDTIDTEADDCPSTDDASGESDTEFNDELKRKSKRTASFYLWRLFSSGWEGRERLTTIDKDGNNGKGGRQENEETTETAPEEFSEEDATPQVFENNNYGDGEMNEFSESPCESETECESDPQVFPTINVDFDINTDIKDPLVDDDTLSNSKNGQFWVPKKLMLIAVLVIFCSPCMYERSNDNKRRKQTKRKNKRTSNQPFSFAYDLKNNNITRNDGQKTSESSIRCAEIISSNGNEISDQIQTQNSIHTECSINRQKQDVGKTADFNILETNFSSDAETRNCSVLEEQDANISYRTGSVVTRSLNFVHETEKQNNKLSSVSTNNYSFLSCKEVNSCKETNGVNWVKITPKDGGNSANQKNNGEREETIFKRISEAGFKCIKYHIKSNSLSREDNELIFNDSRIFINFQEVGSSNVNSIDSPAEAEVYETIQHDGGLIRSDIKPISLVQISEIQGNCSLNYSANESLTKKLLYGNVKESSLPSQFLEKIVEIKQSLNEENGQISVLSHLTKPDFTQPSFILGISEDIKESSLDVSDIRDLQSRGLQPNKREPDSYRNEDNHTIGQPLLEDSRAFEDEKTANSDHSKINLEKTIQVLESGLSSSEKIYITDFDNDGDKVPKIVELSHHENPENANYAPPPGKAPINTDDYISRLQSFHGLSNAWYSAEEFARAGFYVVIGNRLACQSCSFQVGLEDVVSCPPSNPRWHHSNCSILHQSSNRQCYRLHSGRSQNVQGQECGYDDVEADGSVSDDIRDPPGQQSIYIPPGDSRKETYRLSTFEHFPVACPISRKSLASAGFYFTGFFDRVKCFACGRTVERWDETDNPTDLRFHKPSCPFPRGEDCGNIPVRSLFNRSSQASSSRQREEVLQQTDPNTGGILRTVRYPADLPERIRQSGGIFEIGPDNSVRIQAGPGRPRNPANVGIAATHQPPRRWRMANVISSDHRRFLTNLHLNRELDRTASFARWPVGRPNISPAALARSGFFYLGDMDRTQCFSCGGVLRNWTLDDDAQTEHRTHFPQCQMVLGTEDRNFPVQEYPDTPSERVRDYPCRFPSNPHMRNAAAREDTFDRRWPAGKTASTPQEISQAGFFFLGERDRVKCWYCNGGLQNWEYDDMPWIEHAKWFPTCQFLLQVKGQHFVYRHLSMNPHLARPIIAKQDGASVDPTNRAGNSGESSNNRSVDVPPSGPRNQQPEPVPEIIDPQAEMRKRKEKVKHIMQNSDLVKGVLMMGFDGKIVEVLLEDKLESGNVANPDDIYDSMSALLDDVMKKEEEIKKDEEEERMRQMQAVTNVKNVSGAAAMSFPSYSSVYSSMSTPMSSLGPAPGSGKYQVSYIDENDEAMDEDMYGAAEAGPSLTEVTPAKQLLNTEENTKSLQEQLNQIEEERLCKICFSNPADMVFIPCSHMICCMECTQAIRQCPVCRKKIEKAIKTYVN